MAKPHPIELRERVVTHVEEGHSHQSTARHFRVSVKFVNDMVILKRQTGSLAPRPNKRRTGHGKLAPHKEWIAARVEEQPDITLARLCLELEDRFGLKVNRSPVGRLLHQLGLSHKKRHFTPRNNTAPM